MPTLEPSDSEDEEYSDEASDDGDRDLANPTGMKHLYKDSTWKKESFGYFPEPKESTGCGGLTLMDYYRMPTFMMFFQIFWLDTLLQRIVTKTNQYATTVGPDGNTPRGPTWRLFTMAGLKAFFAISILMGLKKQPNVKTYWQRKGSFFHCPVISQIFIRDRHQQITKCLHVTNPASYVTNREEPGYDKMRQVHWLVDKIREACMRKWTLGKYITMDEMMMRYNGSYCPAQQYMPKKPQ
jgi:hypothetical protein